MLASLPAQNDPNVLIGFSTSDDAGVYFLSDEMALVQTVDFFTPIVDEPYLFGAIAAANALSDVYAMGGKPLTSLSILAWPADAEFEDLAQILRGGADKMIEAGCTILGGHSINDVEPKFGYAVTGIVHPKKVKANAGAKVGDVLVLTKAIGTGVISTAEKRGIANKAHVAEAIKSMCLLNRQAAEAMAGLDVHGLTDVTGFGLLGHAREMALASGVTLVIESAHVKLMGGALEYSRAGAIPGGLNNNREFAGGEVDAAPSISSELLNLLYDPQTSGGLLASLSESNATQLLQLYPAAFVVGHVSAKMEKAICVL